MTRDSAVALRRITSMAIPVIVAAQNVSRGA
jgi:hypothetical protein